MEYKIRFNYQPSVGDYLRFKINGVVKTFTFYQINWSNVGNRSTFTLPFDPEANTRNTTSNAVGAINFDLSISYDNVDSWNDPNGIDTKGYLLLKDTENNIFTNIEFSSGYASFASDVNYSPSLIAFNHTQGSSMPSKTISISGDNWKIIGRPNFVLSSPTSGVTITSDPTGTFQIISGSGNANIIVTLGAFYNSKAIFSSTDLGGNFEIQKDNVFLSNLTFIINVNRISDFLSIPYADNSKAFTLDNKYFEVFSNTTDTYFQFDTTIKVYDFFTNNETVHTIPQKLVLFKGKAKINIGKLIHRLMDNFELPNATLIQYKTADVQIYCAEKKLTDNSILRSGTSPVIKFVAGLSRGIVNTGILDFNQKPSRVTKNSFAYINILIPEPVNCVVSEWSSWSQCIDSSQSRTRTIITPALYGGIACPVLSESQSCAMPVNCEVSEWSEWSECVDGTQTRSRTVIIPASNGGTACPVLSETRSCEVDPTPVNCVVSTWSAWSECVEGSQTRTRTVITPASNGGTACPVLSETRSCSQTVRLSYAVSLSGGMENGGFSINVNGVNVYSTNSTDSGYFDVPTNSDILVVLTAPKGTSPNEQINTYYSRIIATTNSVVVDSGFPISNSISSINFIATGDVSIDATASVGINEENPIL